MLKRGIIYIGILVNIFTPLHAADFNQDSVINLLNSTDVDTVRALCLEQLAENIADDNIWPLYNDSVSDLADKYLQQDSSTFWLQRKANVLNNFGYFATYQGKLDSAIYFYEQGLTIYNSLDNMIGISGILNNLAFIQKENGDTEEALELYHKSLSIKKEFGKPKDVAISYHNIASLHQDRGDLRRALTYFQEALKVYQQIGNRVGEADILNNLGTITLNQNNYEEALQLFKQSRAIYRESNDFKKIANVLNNIGNVHRNMNEYNVALRYYIESKEYYVQSGTILGEGTPTVNAGDTYLKLGELDSAETYFNRALEINSHGNRPANRSFILRNLAELNLKKDKNGLALTLALESYEIAKRVGYPKNIESSANTLSRAYEKLGNVKMAFKFYRLHVRMHDSIYNSDIRKESLKHEILMEFDAKEQTLAIEQAQKDAQRKSEKLRGQLVTSISIIAMIISIVYLFILANRIKLIRKQKRLIEDQKSLVDAQKIDLTTKNNKITDSINYAQRIQNAILPTPDEIAAHLSSFQLYVPKDIVSGDFYWFHKGTDFDYLCVADCTGHGVPGAFMSIVGHSLLEKIVIQSKLTDPSQILNQLTIELKETLNKGGQSDVKDGMDLSFIAIDKSRTTCYLAGARSTVYFIRDGELTSYETGLLPIGEVSDDHRYETTKIALQKDDVLYLFSDGFADQKGGPNGKKYYYKPFQSFILAQHLMPMSDQLNNFKAEFTRWKGNQRQLDDVCVVGIRI